MIRTWNFDTCKCGKGHMGTIVTRAKVPQTTACACGRRVGWAMHKGSAIGSNEHGMYGKFEPGLGCVVEDYAHKQRLMKELGVIEGADPVGGSRCHQPNEEETQPRLPQESNDSTWLNKEDLATAQQDALERASRGEFDVTL